jgi:hypothetical protein
MSGRYPDGVPARPDEVTWPLLSGLIPQLADSNIPRQETGLSLAASLVPGDTAVLIPADEANRTLGGLGGTGKTQLALAVAHTLWDRRSVELVLWLTPSNRDAVIIGYAQAMRDVGGSTAEGPEAAAVHFLDWLTQTDRPWLVILDDLGDAAVLEGLWPHGPQGRVLVTSRRPDTAVRAYRPRAVEVGPFSPREALAYLSSKLHADPDQWIGALDLAGDLGYLPIALAQAAALMADTGLDCRQYRARVTDRMQRLAGAPASAYPSIVASTWALATEFAEQIPPAGLARPALALVAMLDPNGIPGAVLTSQAACAYLTRYRRGAAVDEMQARAALYNLARAGLVSTTPPAPPARCGCTAWCRPRCCRTSPRPRVTRPRAPRPRRCSRCGPALPSLPRSSRHCATARRDCRRPWAGHCGLPSAIQCCCGRAGASKRQASPRRPPVTGSRCWRPARPSWDPATPTPSWPATGWVRPLKQQGARATRRRCTRSH